MPTMLDSIDPAQIALAIRNGARPDALLGYSDGRFDDYRQIAAEAGGLPVYALDVYGNTANAEGEDTEPGNISVPGAAAALAAEKARGVDRPIGYCPESWAQALVGAASAHGLSASATAAGRTDWRLLTAHYGQGPHICGPSTCGCQVEANGTQWIDVGPHGENVDQSILDANFITAASHPGPAPTPAPPPRPLPKGHHMNRYLVEAVGSPSGDVQPGSWWILDFDQPGHITRTLVPGAELAALNTIFNAIGMFSSLDCGEIVGFPLA